MLATTPPPKFRDVWSDYLHNQEHRSVSKFIGYALCATDEALRDSNWLPTEQNDKERTVSIIFHTSLGILCQAFGYIVFPD